MATDQRVGEEAPAAPPPRPVRWWVLPAWVGAAAAWGGLAVPLRALLADADRGLDLTDESHYLLAAQQWAGSSAFNGVFGWYLGPWLRLMGNDVAALRVAGVLVVVAAALWLGRCACLAAATLRGRPVPAPVQALVLPAVAAAALLHYVLFLRTPSYDLFATLGLLPTAAGVALLVADDGRSSRWREAAIVASLGLGLGVTAIGKLSSAAGALVVVVLTLVAFPAGRRVARLLGVGGVLAALVLVHLTVVSSPGETITALRRAGAVAGTLDPRHYALSAMPGAALAGVRDVLTLRGSWLGVLALLPLSALPVKGRGRSPLLAALALPGLVVPTVLLVLAYAGGRVVTGDEASFALVALATGVVLALVQQRLRAALAAAALLALAVCYPLGTNNDYLLFMTGSVAVAAAGGVVGLAGALPGRWGLSLVAVLMAACVVTPAVALPAVREKAPYRMVPLDLQTVPVAVVPGAPPLLLDPRTATWVEQLRSGAAGAGWQPGAPLLDLSVNPAAVLALDARAPGVLLPTFPRWEARIPTARTALSFEDPAVWRRAWLLVPARSAPQHGAPDATTDVIVEVLGRRFPEDYRKVVTVRANFRRDDVELWQPVRPR